MSHLFDTGKTLPQRTLIRRGVVQLLAPVKLPGGYLVNVIPWGSVVRNHTDEEGVTELVDALARTPSVAIACGDAMSKPAGIGGFQHEKKIELLVYIASGHQRNRLLGRTEQDVVADVDDHADPGIDVIMEHVAQMIVGQRCGASPTVKQVMPDREEELFTSPAVTIWLQTYKVEVRTNIVKQSAVAGEFRAAAQPLESIRFRAAIEPTEVPPPDPATDSASIDVNVDDLGA